jgi:hypothetical protein
MKNLSKFLWIYAQLCVIFCFFEAVYLKTYFLFFSGALSALFFVLKGLECKSCGVAFLDKKVVGTWMSFNPKKIWATHKLFDTCKVCGGVFME